MDYILVQQFDFGRMSNFSAWLQDVLVRSSAMVPNANQLAGTASRAITLATCSSDLSGQRERTLVTFVV
ncbi:MAG: hypothetical protein IKG22_13055 [Atopobiaceae bacterium]|nr:hypothetical protein [Atopobiaceae bacterium]